MSVEQIAIIVIIVIYSHLFGFVFASGAIGSRPTTPALRHFTLPAYKCLLNDAPGYIQVPLRAIQPRQPCVISPLMITNVFKMTHQVTLSCYSGHMPKIVALPGNI